MNSRDSILQRIRQNQPERGSEMIREIERADSRASVDQFKNILVSIGGAVLEMEDEAAVQQYILNHFPPTVQIAVNFQRTATSSGIYTLQNEPKKLKHIDVAVLPGEFAVAENGAVWITEKQMIDRVLPFICTHLILIIKKTDIVPTLHEAYTRIGNAEYGFGTFIAGPSKTADIEQSLVLGAHGPKTTTVILIERD